MKRRISELNPILYHARIGQQRLFRRVSDVSQLRWFASLMRADDLPFRCKKHLSLLRRRPGNADPQLQENKIHNLRIAIQTIDGLVIKPGEIFSFWKRVGESEELIVSNFAEVKYELSFAPEACSL